jgi:hypothetical protein
LLGIIKNKIVINIVNPIVLVILFMLYNVTI